MNRPDDAQLESLLKLAHEAESIDPPALRLLTAEPEPSAAVSEPARAGPGRVLGPRAGGRKRTQGQARAPQRGGAFDQRGPAGRGAVCPVGAAARSLG